MSQFFRGRPSKKQARDPSNAGEVEVALITMLARREHTAGQARGKLQARGFDGGTVDAVLADFVERHLLDDARFAQHFIASRAGRGQGPQRLRQELRELGLSEAVIQAALAAGPDFRALCRELRIRKFGAESPADWPQKAKQMRFLQYRGFSSDHIRSALDTE